MQMMMVTMMCLQSNLNEPPSRPKTFLRVFPEREKRTLLISLRWCYTVQSQAFLHLSCVVILPSRVRSVSSHAAHLSPGETMWRRIAVHYAAYRRNWGCPRAWGGASKPCRQYFFCTSQSMDLLCRSVSFCLSMLIAAWASIVQSRMWH